MDRQEILRRAKAKMEELAANNMPEDRAALRDALSSAQEPLVRALRDVGADESGEDESGWDKLKSCAADQLGVTNLGLAGAASGANVLPTRGKFDGATPGSSPTSKVATRLFGDRALPFRVPTLTGFPLKGKGVTVRWTGSVARVTGRWLPVVGWTLVAYDVGSISLYMASR